MKNQKPKNNTNMKTITIKNVKFKSPQKKSYPKSKLKQGMNTEKEHTGNKKVQKIIAANHLDEDSNYYSKLAKVERKKRKNVPRGTYKRRK